MAFNAEKFAQAAFRPRTETLDLPALAPFFDAGEAPRWTVRGLTASEFARAQDAEKRNSSIDMLMGALAAAQSKGEAVDAARKALGLSSANTPGEVAKRLEMLVAGSVEPAVTMEIAVLLAERFAIDFYVITNKIVELTGQGFDLPKPDAASPTTADCA
ncbi:MAG TPA: hypothetical protein P5305_03780 [Rubrivivax sp.]|nr:hypothetical protein [Rubrivivax sp.]HRY86981.1 hypothetical protein [Rubrivivax sp.]